MKLGREHITILVIMITEVLGFSLILPFLPFYAQEFGATPLTIGLILASFSFFQFISAPIMGRLSDHYGRKPLLVLSQLSTFVSFIILGFANSLWMIFLSRIVDGLLGSNYTIAQAYLSDISSTEDRTKVFGLSGVAFGIGFLIGPGIGGFLSGISYSLPAFLAAGVSGLTILITSLFLPETIKRKKDFKLDIKIFQLDDFKRFFRDDATSPMMWQFFTYLLAHVLWVSSFALYAERQIGIGPMGVGYVLMYIGLTSIILRGGLLPKLVDFFGDHTLQYMGIIAIIIGMMVSVFTTSWIGLLLLATMFSFGSGISRPVMLSGISRSVPQTQQGTVLGVANSLGSIAQIIGPLVGGFMINYFFPGSLGIISAFVMTIGLMMMIREDLNGGK